MREVYPVPDAIFEQHSAWLATSGAGKTTAVKGGVERILARGERVVVIDPTGVWWGLRFGRDGRRASGLEPVVLGRHHADLPLEEGSGEAVAHALGGSSTSAILNLKGMSVAARSRFITAFFETLVDANKGVLHLVIDEVHLFAPQSGGSGLTPAMLHATNNMVSLGRSAGLRIVMISQRPAKVHKDSLTQAKALVALQLSHPLDQRPVRDWLSTTVSDKLQEAEILRSLAGLPVGEGWLSAPQLGLLGRVRFPMIATYDSSRAGAEEIPLKPLDVGALRKAMAANSPSVDKSVDTKTPKANGKAGLVDERPPSAAELAAAEQRGYERGLGDGAVKAARQGWTSALNEARDAIAAVAEKLELRQSLDDEMAARLAGCPLANVESPPPRQKSSPPAKKAAIAAPPDKKTTSSPDLTPSLQRVLDALGWWRAAGFPWVHRARAAVMAGYSPKASTFGVYISDLVKRGLVETGSGTVGLTDAGLLCADVPAHVTAAELRASARALLKPQEARAFDVICDAGGQPIRRDDVAIALGLSTTASTAGVYISAVTAYGLIEPAGRGEVRAAPWLFEVRQSPTEITRSS